MSFKDQLLDALASQGDPLTRKALRGRAMPEVLHWEIERLKPDPRNARTHSEAQIAKIAELIENFGWTTAILVDEDGKVLAGHGRLKAAKRLRLPTVPVMIARGWSDGEKRAYALADNRVALDAGWDAELLALELGELADGGFDLGLTGFSADELGGYLGHDAAAEEGAKIERVETGRVLDIFWVQVRGPLKLQADALDRIKQLLGEMPELDIMLGTTPRDG